MNYHFINLASAFFYGEPVLNAAKWRSWQTGTRTGRDYSLCLQVVLSAEGLWRHVDRGSSAPLQPAVAH